PDSVPTRRSSDLLGTLPDWIGADIWNAYEISWLNSKGKPVVATATFTVPQNSPNLVESKSFKLYLNSFNEERFEDQSEVVARMRRDISAACGAQVEVELLTLAEQTGSVYRPMDGINIDDIDVEIDVYTPSPNLLQ